VVVEVAEGEGAEAWRERVILAVVRDAQGALEVDGEPGLARQFGETHGEVISMELDHSSFLSFTSCRRALPARVEAQLCPACFSVRG